MRIAVAGGTGLVGGYAVDAVRKGGHDAVVLSRSQGVDVVSGDGLAAALAGVDAVIDATNSPATDPDEAVRFFGTATGNLLKAGTEAGVRHHVALSIVGVDRAVGNAHYEGKRHQEELVEAGPVPWTIVRAAQFYEFAGLIVSWTRSGDTVVVPPLLTHAAAAVDVGAVLAEVAAGAPQGRYPDVVGPDPLDLVDMTRRWLAVRGEDLKLVPSWQGPMGPDMAGDVTAPGEDARHTPTTFEAWLETQRPA